MLRCLGLYCLLFFIPFHVKSIEATTAHTVFYMPAADGKNMLKPYVELYWQINPKTIHYTKTENNQWVGKVITQVIFRDENDNIVSEDKYILQTTPADSNAILNQSIVELRRYELPPGKLFVDLELTEVAVPGNKYRFNDSVIIDTPPAKPFYSGLQILDTTFNSQAQTVFFRNDRQQVPLCYNFLDDSRRTLNVYAELYKSLSIDQADYPLVQRVFISKKVNDKQLLDFQHTDTIQPADVVPVLSGFNIESLTSGNYYLNVVLENKNKTVLASNSLFFQRSNTKPVIKKTDTDTTRKLFEKVEVFDVGSTFVGKFNVSQLKAVLKMIYPISTPLEENAINTFLKKPEETYMRFFVYNFWQSRNEKDPQKPWDEYAKRIREVNKLFGTGVVPGYETDRGIIWLKYGKPNVMIPVQNEPGVLPYEVWQYNAPGKQSSPGAFLFYRPGFMVNDYRLLHSTVNGEMRNLNWRSVLYTSGGGGGNANSRAEQYMGNK